MQIRFAVRGILNKLNEKFNNTNFLFAEFYDFDRGLDPYFKRRLSQVPMAERGKNWIAIMWSRDPQQQSSNNRQYTVTLNSDSLYAETTEVRYVYCSVVFTYISNSMSYLERCEKQFFQYVPDGFSTYFDNTPYSDWNAKQKIGEGYRRLARRYNGYVYQCTQAGTTGNQEPTWTSSGEIKDGSVIWKPIEPDQLKVQIDSIAYSGLQKYSLDEEDTLCSLTIGGRMFLPLLLGEVDENTGELDMSDSTNGIYPRILYPKGEISTTNNFPEYEEYVSPTKDYWRKKLGF